MVYLSFILIVIVAFVAKILSLIVADLSGDLNGFFIGLVIVISFCALLIIGKIEENRKKIEQAKEEIRIIRKNLLKNKRT